MKWKARINPISVMSLVLAMVLALPGVGCSVTPSPASNTDSLSAPAGISLTVSEPADNTITDVDTIEVRGHTSPGAVVSVNAMVTIADSDGNFDAIVSLDEGPNIIETVASDETGDQASVTLIAQCDIAATGLWAQHVIVVPDSLEGGKSEYGYKHYAGNVMTYDYDPNMGGTITIQDESGNLIPFQINDGDFGIMPSGATVTTGGWVTVISYHESPSAQLMAVGLRIYLQWPPSLSHARWTEEQRAERSMERTVPERWR